MQVSKAAVLSTSVSLSLVTGILDTRLADGILCGSDDRLTEGIFCGSENSDITLPEKKIY